MISVPKISVRKYLLSIFEIKEPKKGSYSSLGGKNKSEWKDIIYNRKLNDVSINGWNELNNINISYLFEHTRSFYYVVQCRINNFDCREKWTLKVRIDGKLKIPKMRITSHAGGWSL